ncbi:MAG: hypothetical protein HFF14_05095 [Angelakisella sp.]|jgi:hypothetical protein|nr:hypothetical protein [Angelakisella sp.]
MGMISGAGAQKWQKSRMGILYNIFPCRLFRCHNRPEKPPFTGGEEGKIIGENTILQIAFPSFAKVLQHLL